MKLTDAKLGFYVDDVLALKPEHKVKYQDQIEFLIDTITNSINANSTLGVLKIVQAGSWAKGTALKPRDGIDLDIDLVVYLDVSKAERGDLTKLHARIIELLKTAYPQKSADDFKPSRKTVGITFRTSGLKVDLVPAVPLKTPDGYVWQPETGGSGSYTTSPPEQLQFVRNLKKLDARFASVVRLLKRWRNQAELDALSSFVLELVAAHVVETSGVSPTVEEGLIRVLLYIAQSGLKERLSFTGAIGGFPRNETTVRVYDPTNNENNAASKITETERIEIISAAGLAAENLNLATRRRERGDTLRAWEQVMGTPFRIEDCE